MVVFKTKTTPGQVLLVYHWLKASIFKGRVNRTKIWSCWQAQRVVINSLKSSWRSFTDRNDLMGASDPIQIHL